MTRRTPATTTTIVTTIVTALVVALTGVLAVALSASPATAVADRDCGDFSSQRAAQIFFLNAGGPRNDPHRLDAEGDGVACESNPAPYYYGKTPPKAGGGSGGGATQPSRPPRKTDRARVTRVVDGDTVDVRFLRGGTARVRMIGIDTPEVYGGTECGGPAASAAAKRMLPRGTVVTLVSDRSQDLKDRYGRILRYVVKGNTDINRAQVARGNAQVYVYDRTPFERVSKYRTAQTKAKRQRLGQWGSC